MNQIMSQAHFIEKHLMDALNDNPEYTNHQLISLVTEKGFLRPTVRRVKGELLAKLVQYASILKDEVIEK